jgi:hypothetical protein
LIQTLNQALDKKNVQFVYASRLAHDNLLIDDKQIFIGARRVREWGFSSTTIIHDPTAVQNEIKEFDLTFKEVAEAILQRQNVNSEEFGSRDLKLKVIEHLRLCETQILELSAKQPKAGAGTSPST